VYHVSTQIKMLTIILGGICILFPLIIHVLEALHLMEWLKRWPGLYNFLTNRALLFVLFVIAIGLFGEAIREHRQETKIEQPKTTGPSRQTGSATTKGDNSPAVTGDGNKFNYGATDKDKK
jgi:hypothetical protein